MSEPTAPAPGQQPDGESLTRLSAAVAAPRPPLLPSAADQRVNPAEWMYQRLKNYIKEFERHLDEDHEVGAHLVAFGHDVTFHIQDMGYHGPDIITFYGRNEQGQDVQLIQHTSQLSVLLVAMKKQAPQPRRIGFVLDQKESEQERRNGPELAPPA